MFGYQEEMWKYFFWCGVFLLLWMCRNPWCWSWKSSREQVQPWVWNENVSNETLQKEKVFSLTVLLIVWLYTSGFRLFKPLTETDCIRVELCSPACGRMDLFVCLLRRSSLTFGSAWREAPPRRVLLHLCTHSSTMKRANGNSWEINLAVSFCLARWASESSGGNAAEWDHFSLKEALKVHLWQFRGFLPNWWGFTEDITEDQDQD